MLYLLGGENLYLSRKRLEEIEADFRQRFTNSVIQIINADEIEDSNDILKDADSYSLFYKEKLLIIKRLLSCKKELIDKVVDYLQSAKKINFVFWEDRSLDKRRSLYKIIRSKGVVEEYDKLKYTRIKSWLTKQFNSRVDIDDKCIELLIMKVGEDQSQLEMIANNLIISVIERGKKKILVSDIEELVEKSSEDSIWELVDCLSVTDRAKALKIIEGMLREKQDFVMIIGILARQFRILSLVKYLSQKDKSSSEITNTLKLHPFVVRKAITQADNFTMEQLKKLYQKLVKTDLVVKEGRFAPKLALDLLVAAI